MGHGDGQFAAVFGGGEEVADRAFEEGGGEGWGRAGEGEAGERY